MTILYNQIPSRNLQEPSACASLLSKTTISHKKHVSHKLNSIVDCLRGFGRYPASNTGGNSYSVGIFAENFNTLRVSGGFSALSLIPSMEEVKHKFAFVSKNKIVVRKYKDATVHVDTLSLTSKLEKIKSKVMHILNGEEHINELNFILQETLGLKMSADIRSGKNFYKNSCELQYTDGRPCKSLGFVAWGGNADTYQLHLTGEGMEYINMNSLNTKLYRLACDLEMKITRGDIAWDDLEGEISVTDIIKMYKNNEFKITRNPKIKLHGNFVTPDTDGRTVEIGSRESGKMMRAYEKGKQLGNKLSKWVRLEVELHAKDRVIPLKMILCPNLYFSGAYPALNKIVPSDASEIIKTAKKKAKITIDKAVENAKTQFGRLLNFMKMSGDSAEEIFSKLCRTDGIPSRLVFPIPKISTGYDDLDIVMRITPTSIVEGWQHDDSLIPF